MLDSVGAIGKYIPQGPQSVAAGGGFTAKSESETSTTVPATGAPFSPTKVSLDPVSKLVIYQRRDTVTGDVINQYPTQHVVDAYRKAATGNTSAPIIQTMNNFGAGIKIDTPTETPPPTAPVKNTQADSVPTPTPTPTKPA